MTAIRVMSHRLPAGARRRRAGARLLALLLLALLLPRAAAQPADSETAILYMAYDDSVGGTVLSVTPAGYHSQPVPGEALGADAAGRYQREQMLASDDGRWLALSLRDTLEDVIVWVPILALDGAGGGTALWPLPITHAVNLGAFSPDGRYLALAVVGQDSPEAPPRAALLAFDLAGDPEGDAPIKWWLPLEPQAGELMWAETGAWTAQGVQFRPVCYDCDTPPAAGEYALWQPLTGTVTPASGAFFMPDMIVLPATGEALRLESAAEFPRDPGVTGPNVVRYRPAVNPAAPATTLYADPRGIALAQWVLDGAAVLVQPAGVHDTWVLIDRAGRVVEYPHSLGVRFVVGSTTGWFVETGNADGYTDILHVDGAEFTYLVSGAGGVAVLRPPYLGSSLPRPLPAFPPVLP
ncbi:MAG: hypothetical protein MUE40_11795 [Anaerolineae bacterium]|nr:hypothetical protein [Anaerolineae bacterium]